MQRNIVTGLRLYDPGNKVISCTGLSLFMLTLSCCFSSAHLYFMLPYKPEGGLAMYRSALVQNKHLAQLAQVSMGRQDGAFNKQEM